MSIDTTVTVKRGSSNTVITTGVGVQIDNMSVMMAASIDAGHIFDQFEVYVKYTAIPILREDTLMDEINNDPLSGTNALYRVAGNPESFPDGHVELICQRYGKHN